MAKAQEKDIAKRTRKAAAKASKQTTADLEQLGKKLGEQISSAQGGSRSLLEAIKASGPEIERLIEAEVLPKLKEFGEEARQMSEQGKLKSADLTQKAKTEFAATSERIADKAADVVERAESEVLPAVKTQAGEIAEQAKQTAEHFGEEAKESLNQFATVADEKRKVAAASAREAVVIRVRCLFGLPPPGRLSTAYCWMNNSNRKCERPPLSCCARYSH
ncbi:MAG: hypothetical protein M9950_06105 [Thermomicrobiales bacterium]|nr:hypothetical protein [Thermomicrobiales bacterium]